MPDDPIHFVRGRPLKLLDGPQDDDFDFFPRSPAPNVPLPKPVAAAAEAVRASRQGEI
jgi:hypothetical protein